MCSALSSVVKVLLLVLFLLGSARAQIPPPPPKVPVPVPGEPAPFDPSTLHEAKPMVPMKIVLPGEESEPIRQLELAEAIAAAWENEPDVLEAEGTLRLRTGNVVSRRSVLNPRISVDSSYSHVVSKTAAGGTVIVGDQVIGGGSGASRTTSDRLSNRIGFRQLLFDFGYSRNLILEADLLQQASAADLLSVKNDVALNVKEQFYGLTLAQRLVAVAEDDVANRQKQLELSRALYDAGELAAGDVVRAQTSVSNSVVSLNESNSESEIARQNLIVSLGLSPLAPLSVVPSIEPDLPDKELLYLLDKARRQRPDLLASQRTVRAREAGLGAAYALNKPELSTFAGVTYQGAVDGVQYPTLTAQLNLSFDIYDGGARAGAVTTAEGALEISQAQLKRTELRVEQLITRVLVQLKTAEENVEAARDGVESAQEGVRIEEGRYRAALSSLTDVLAAQTALVQARTNLARSENALDIARSRARHALAAPLEENFFPQAEPHK